MGGYRIERNLFKKCVFGVTHFGQSEDVSFITHNVFDNNTVAFNIYVKTCHIKWNKMIATDPGQAPLLGYPDNAGQVIAWYKYSDNNVIAHNTVDGLAEGFILITRWAQGDAATCSNNLITGNKFTNLKIFDPEINLGAMMMLYCAEGISFENNRVLNNTLLGSQGIGIYSLCGTNTTIAGNRISGVRETPNSFIQTGIGIYLDENSHNNKLLRNKFYDNELYDIALFGDNNTVITSGADEKILDEGENNQIMRAGFRAARGKNTSLSDSYVDKIDRKMEFMKGLISQYMEGTE